MSEIKELIERLCPDGVEFKKLGEVAKRLRGTPITATTMKKIATEEGEIKVFAGGKTVINAHLKDIPNANIITVPSVLCQSRGVIDFIYYDKPFTFKNEMWAYTLDNNVSVKYIYYVLKQNVMYFRDKATAMGAFPQISIPDTEKFEIPVPPIEVQSKIVEILDNFTELEAELERKLEAELEARRKQYEYYRNQLLTFDKVGGARFDVKWMTIMDVCNSICSGGTPSTSNRSYYDGNIPWLRTQEVDWTEIYDTSIKITQDALDNSSAKMIPANCVIVAMYGATAAKVAINKIPLCTNQACCNLEINENVVLIKYVYQWLCKEYEKLKSLGEGSQHNINAQKVKKYPIPIPPLEEQKRIVAILDRFEALTTDLQSGLPAEIEARRKQYEYYREKLLTFKRKSA